MASRHQTQIRTTMIKKTENDENDDDDDPHDKNDDNDERSNGDRAG